MLQIDKMAQQDKTDWYWNGVLAGAVNNLYYDLINVDVVHVPYATHHRNSSFFLKTRLAYDLSNSWRYSTWYEDGFDVTDVKIIWDEECDNLSWTVYALARNWKQKRIYATSILDWCVRWQFFNCTCIKVHSWEEDEDDEGDEDCSRQQEWCGDWKLFTTDYVRDAAGFKEETVAESGSVLEKIPGTTATEVVWEATWIQINKNVWWIMRGYFSDENVENWYARFAWQWPKPWNYILVYRSRNWDKDWYAWQVRLISSIEAWQLCVEDAWEWFAVEEGEDNPQRWHVKYAFFRDWWEVLWYTDGKHIRIMYDKDDCASIEVYDQWDWTSSATKSEILWVAATNNKIFVLTTSWYVHYNNWSGWWNKFFIQDDMYAWVDKFSITSYRDMVIAFGRNHLAVWIPDENNEIWTMYNQSNTIWAWSRYSRGEYDWDMFFVSNDKRLMALDVSWTASRYMLDMNDVWQMLNSKLSTLIPWDEVFIWTDNNNLKVFVNTTNEPYDPVDNRPYYANLSGNKNNMTHLYKYDKLFNVYTEDHINGILLQWMAEWVYFWKWGIYIRNQKDTDFWNHPYKTIISAYLIENETDWVWWTTSWLANRPKLYNIAKLNRLITTLWPGEYSENVKIRITNYSKGIWYIYEFPVNGDWNTWLWLITDYYTEGNLSRKDKENLACLVDSIPEEAKQYLANPWCSEDLDDIARIQAVAQQQPWCDDYDELLVESHNVCINDKLYELAPHMPLVTNLGEIQDYSTQIKLELIWWEGDVICFGWRLAEMFIAPLFSTGPDWEYQLQPNTDCN